MRLPLQVRLKKEVYRKIAYAQDLIVNEVYKFFPKAILHGGTGIWRIFNGNRFSEDLDFYIKNDKNMVNEFFESLKNKGFLIIKKKVSERSIYSELQYERISVRFEATFQKVKGALSDYESSDGNSLKIYSLSAEDFLIEKTNAYLKRLKIRDLWDIFFLLHKINDFNKIRDSMSRLVKEYKKPVDEANLSAIILEGVNPSSNQMIEYIEKWQK